ncbi:MAG: acetyl-CoA carboxylase biotin carboxyl carrier protein [Candidatus Aminicenantaceae bacterium]
MSTNIDYREINKIIKLMEEKNLTHFEIEVEGLKIKISRNTSPLEAASIPAIKPSPTPDEGENFVQQEPSLEKKKDKLHYITSPMVGTFYRAPDPSSPPFIEVGDEVKKNQVLCIIEAMKLMNEIEADVDGILEEIYVENGKPIEYGQRLFAIQSLL